MAILSIVETQEDPSACSAQEMAAVPADPSPSGPMDEAVPRILASGWCRLELL